MCITFDNWSYNKKIHRASVSLLTWNSVYGVWDICGNMELSEIESSLGGKWSLHRSEHFEEFLCELGM